MVNDSDRKELPKCNPNPMLMCYPVYKRTLGSNDVFYTAIIIQISHAATRYDNLISTRFCCTSCNNSVLCSSNFAATTQALQSGGHTGASRGAQQHKPNQPRSNCVNLAVSRLLPACHFSVKSSQIPFLMIK